MVDLDLAFAADADLEPGLLAAAGPWAGPLEQAEAAWCTQLAGWLAALQAELPPALRHGSYSLGLSLVGDGAIAELNGSWRGKAGPTDVLAFAAQEPGLDDAPPVPAGAAGEAGDALELGDIVISLATAARQADDHGHGLERELLFLASHGLLHLLGWDHPDAASLAAMLARQEELLGLSLANALLAPAAQANQEAKINARIEAWGRNCKNAIVERHPNAPMAEINVELGATLQQSINSGQTTLKDIEANGLSFNWTLRKHSGYCNTDGNGNVVELKKF